MRQLIVQCDQVMLVYIYIYVSVTLYCEWAGYHVQYCTRGPELVGSALPASVVCVYRGKQRHHDKLITFFA